MSSSDWDENKALSYLHNVTIDSWVLLRDTFNRIPGSDILVRYIKNSHQNDPIRTFIEALLVIFAIWYFTGKTYHPDSNAVKLTEREVDELINEWQPEQLVEAATADEQAELERIPVIEGPVGPKVRVRSQAKPVTHLASYNFLELLHHPEIKSGARKILRAYGVGACGPPGFYGTQDVHMDMERDIANFLGTEACIVYAQAFGTIGSVIPAFAKRGDVIVVDKAVNFAIQKGLQISRCTLRWYEHNDMADLERVLAEVSREQARRGRLTRRFIVTEGIFADYGDLLNLPKVVELKRKYKFRLMLDDTWAFATIGATGRGSCEHWNVNPREIDMLVGSLSTSFCSGGGFCAGSVEVVEHQRITGASYVFSAAMPAMLAVAVSDSINLVRQDPSLFSRLQENARLFRAAIASDGSADIECISWERSPMLHLRLAKPAADEAEELRLIRGITDECLAHGVLCVRAKQVDGSVFRGADLLRSSIRICVTAGHNKQDLERAAKVIKAAFTKVSRARFASASSA
ncbi:serine palmitoyltransferase component [Savitreella phatthalungensis]